MNDEYELYDLKVEVRASDDGKPMVCQHKLGDYFTITDDDLIEFPPGVRFPMYSLAAILPLLPAKQRETKKRLDDDRRNYCLPGSQLWWPLSDYPWRETRLSS